MDVGIPALRDRLSRYLAEVRRGHTVTVIDHGRAIARIVPVGEPASRERPIAGGRITPAKRPKRPTPEPIVATGIVSDLIIEQRR